MKQSKFIIAQVAPNCYKTVAVNLGILQYYSVCVGNTVNLDVAANVYNYQEYPSYNNFSYDYSGIYINRIVNTTKTFYRTPYKQCRSKKYTQNFKFIIFVVFTTWNEVSWRGLEGTFKFNAKRIKDAVLKLKELSVNNK